MKAKVHNLIVRYERMRDRIEDNDERVNMIDMFIDDLKRLSVKKTKCSN